MTSASKKLRLFPGYKIHVNADYESGLRMDIPPKYVSRDNYRATLGHKMNHSFQSNCFEWFFDHPRFGVIPCEKTRRFVAKVLLLNLVSTDLLIHSK